jgi:hypothetical protein
MKGMPMASAPAAPPSDTNVRLSNPIFSSPGDCSVCRFDYAHYCMFRLGQGVTNGIIVHPAADRP